MLFKYDIDKHFQRLQPSPFKYIGPVLKILAEQGHYVGCCVSLYFRCFTNFVGLLKSFIIKLLSIILVLFSRKMWETCLETIIFAISLVMLEAQKSHTSALRD